MMKHYLGTTDFKTRWNPQTKCVEYTAQPRKNWQCTQTGTGRTGLTSWVPDEGVMLQINHTDAWDVDGEQPSILQYCIEIEGNPFDRPISFNGGLDTKNGCITWRAVTADGDVTVRIYAHPLRDVIMIAVEDQRSECGRVSLHARMYHTRFIPSGDEHTFFYTLANQDFSVFPLVNEACKVKTSMPDPLAGLVRGSAARFEEEAHREYGVIKAASAGGETHILINAAVGKCTDADLRKELACGLDEAAAVPFADKVAENDNWWKAFWDKSRFELSKDTALSPLSMVWHTSRFFAATSMRGNYIPKFNGSIFLYEHDQRSWGGQYWQQNTRLQYWPLYKTGDIACLNQYFDMFIKALPYAKERTRSIYGHGGAIFIETMYFWGGCMPRYLENGMPKNTYIGQHFSGSLELLFMMAEYYRYTGDAEFAKTKFLPMAEEILQFFFQHYKVSGGKLRIRANAVETWWDTEQPADIVAGLKAVLPATISIGKKVGSKTAFFESMLGLVPDFSIGKMNYNPQTWGIGPMLPGNCILPAEEIHHKKRENHEDPEMYGIFPFNLMGLGMPDYDRALCTYENRILKENFFGWCQQPVFAARLGLAQEALDRFAHTYDNNTGLNGGMLSSVTNMLDYEKQIPDCCGMDTTGVLAVAVNEMLMQEHTGQIVRRPAWLDSEAVSYKLHAAGGVIVEEEYQPV